MGRSATSIRQRSGHAVVRRILDRGATALATLLRSRSRSRDPDGGACAALAAQRIHPTVVLDRERVSTTAAEWQDRSCADLADLLDDFELDETEDYDLGDAPVHYRLVTFRADGRDLMAEQWLWLIGDQGYTLTGTVALVDYPDFCELFEDVAATFRCGAGSSAA